MISSLQFIPGPVWLSVRLSLSVWLSRVTTKECLCSRNSFSGQVFTEVSNEPLAPWYLQTWCDTSGLNYPGTSIVSATGIGLCQDDRVTEPARETAALWVFLQGGPIFIWLWLIRKWTIFVFQDHIVTLKSLWVTELTLDSKSVNSFFFSECSIQLGS